MKLSGWYEKNQLWEVLYNHVVEDTNQNYEIVLQVFYFNVFDSDEG